MVEFLYSGQPRQPTVAKLHGLRKNTNHSHLYSLFAIPRLLNSRIAFPEDDPPNSYRKTSMTVPMRLPLALALSLAYPCAHATAEESTTPVVTVLISGERLGSETEGSGSYTSGTSTIGKSRRSLRETPQSVSVVTRQRIEDQNLRTLDEALQNTTGLTIEQGSSIERTYYSRGFAVDTVQYDGVPTQRGTGFGVSPDLALYDRVEVLRGPAGLFNGAGQPGGTVNLVRKRPLKTPQLMGQVSAGSWDNYRADADASVLLNDRGSVRARVVGARENRGYFYDVANNKRSVLYAVVEADVAARTTLGAGVQYEKNDLVPFYGGLPRYADGRDLEMPRSTYLNAAWSHTEIASTTAFADLNHRFANNWKLKLAVTRMREDSDDNSGSAFGTVNPATNTGPSLSAFRQGLLGKQDAADATLEGSFEAYGRQHDVLVGANWQQRRFDMSSQLYTVANPVINPFTFDPYAYRVMPATPGRPATHTLTELEQSGVYGSLRLALADRVRLILGGRVSNWQNSVRNLVTGAYSTAPYKENGEFTPYGALSVDISRDWTTYLSYAEIFRSQANLFTADGERLAAATGSNYEAGLKGALFGGRLNAALALFRIIEDNRSQADPAYPSPCAGSPTGGACYVAEGRVRSQGLDAELSGQLLPGWQLSAGYTFNQTRYLRDRSATGLPSSNENQPLSTFTPRHLARVWSSYQPAGSSWSLGGGVNAQDESYKTSGALRLGQPAYAVWSGRVGYRINRNLTASVNLNNVFDKRYYRTLGSTNGSNWYGEPRNVTATLQALF
jgi:outer membrane receptor for ferric coprogen and ferric-rhodotorulic acid